MVSLSPFLFNSYAMKKQVIMRHFLFLFAALLYCGIGNAQQSQKLCACSTEVFLNIDLCEDDSIPVYNNAERDSVIAYVKNNCKQEIVMQFKVMHKKGDMLHVVAYNFVPPESSVEGWVNIKSPLCIFTRDIYSEGYYAKPLILYSRPSETSPVLHTLDYYLDGNGMCPVLDYHGEWLKVRCVLRGKVYTGWIPPEMQCSSPYTTCP